MQKAAALGNDLEQIKEELKRVQSVKCRLAKQKFKKSYEEDMREVVAEEQLLKEARAYLLPKKPTVTTITLEQVKLLGYDDTIKAIKSIQSKKTNTKYLTEDRATNVEYQDACRIEKMLLEHKATIQPVEETVVKKSDLNATIEHIKSLNLTTEQALEMMAKLLSK